MVTYVLSISGYSASSLHCCWSVITSTDSTSSVPRTLSIQHCSECCKCFLLAVLPCYNLSGLLKSFSTRANWPQTLLNKQSTWPSTENLSSPFSITFIICFSPMAIFPSVLMPVLIHKKEVVPLYNASVILLFISSSLNPGLYLWRMTCTYPK